MKNSIKATLFLLVILIFTILGIYTASAEDGNEVFINEIMSFNTSNLTDEAGEYYDWIELYNASDTVVNLGGYGLSDNNLNPYKWVFPDITLEPHNYHNYLVVFASDKNIIVSGEKIERLIIDQGYEWNYKVWTSEPPTEWRNLEFDDSGWGAGPSGFGYEDVDDATILPDAPVSVYIRKKFTLGSLSEITGALLQMDYDDAFVAYLNGVEIARDNIGTKGVPVPFDEYADISKEANLYRGRPLINFPVENALSILKTGENILAIQGHNADNSADLSLIPFFSLTEKGLFIHTNFKIAEGETLILTDSGGTTLDQVTVGYSNADVSQGRKPDGSSEWFYFTRATPMIGNFTEKMIGYAPAPLFSIPGGFYSSGEILTITPDSPGTTIRYTEDGSDPTENSSEFHSQKTLNSTVVYRARAYKDGYFPSPITTNTYVIRSENITLPVVSLSTDPANFFDSKTGIYVNYRSGWERPVHIEFFEPDGTLGFSVDAGVRIHGAVNASSPQKTLALFARKKYGYGSFKYQIFPDMPIDEFEAFIVRNSGQDFLSMFRDPLITSFAEGTDIDYQAYRPSILFINGQYWGLYNIREKINEHFIASHHGVNTDNIDIMEYDIKHILVYGDKVHFDSMIQYIETHDLSEPTFYEYMKTLVDVDQFIDYFAVGVYSCNADWPGRNVKFWRPKTPEGKWKWILYDTDFGYGNPYYNSYPEYNHLWLATHPDTTTFSTFGPSTTIIVRSLLKNEDFKNQFINRFADFLNSRFLPEKALERIDKMQAVIRPEMPSHFTRWGDSMNHSMPKWEQELDVLTDFASRRPFYQRNHIREYFGIANNVQVRLEISPENSGSIRINTLDISEFPWAGYYFSNIPVEVTAIPGQGYGFAGWQGASSSDSATVTLGLSTTVNLTALFEKDEGPFGPIVINEINYNSSDIFNPEDWVELYNNGNSSVDISNWRFMDEDDTHFFDLPSGTVLGAGQFLILCRDSQAFTSLFPLVDNYIGDLGFGLSGAGELIRLLNSQGTIIDSLIYDDVAPWPVEPDGNGPTLALINPNTDNSIPLNWAASLYHGTPGVINDVIKGVDEDLNDVPRQFSLDQNYPNPFNPFTTIRFGLPGECEVTIEVFNILGQRVATLQKGYKPAGYHMVHFEGSVVSSGLYFYRIKTASFEKCRKMLLIK